MTGREFHTMNAWRRLSGYPELDQDEIKPKPTMSPMEVLRETEWSPEFEKLMRNRMLMGAFRYGLLHANVRPNYGYVDSIERRLKIFRETGNMEYLVDIANICLIIFETKAHPNAHFESVDDGEHAVVVPEEVVTLSEEDIQELIEKLAE